jgi:hypothetical protein
MAKPVVMKLVTYVLTPDFISTAYFINPSHQSACLYAYSHITARKRLGKNVTAATNTRNSRIVWCVVFYAVRVVWKESRQLVLPRSSSFTAVCAIGISDAAKETYFIYV